MALVRQYSLHDIQDEVRALVARGSIGRHSRIYELVRYFSDRKWEDIEQILDANEYLMRDCVVDLIGRESWAND